MGLSGSNKSEALSLDLSPEKVPPKNRRPSSPGLNNLNMDKLVRQDSNRMSSPLRSDCEGFDISFDAMTDLANQLRKANKRATINARLKKYEESVKSMDHANSIKITKSTIVPVQEEDEEEGVAEGDLPVVVEKLNEKEENFGVISENNNEIGISQQRHENKDLAMPPGPVELCDDKIIMNENQQYIPEPKTKGQNEIILISNAVSRRPSIDSSSTIISRAMDEESCSSSTYASSGLAKPTASMKNIQLSDTKAKPKTKKVAKKKNKKKKNRKNRNHKNKNHKKKIEVKNSEEKHMSNDKEVNVSKDQSEVKPQQEEHKIKRTHS